MNLELDHVFILVQSEARVADLLIAKGFEEGTRNIHPGQGTSNRRFFFANGMLEFIWIRDAEEAENGSGRDLRFPERDLDSGASPFGVILRQKDGVNLETSKMPFNGWSYQPIYFEPPNAFHVGANSTNIFEPLCIYVPFSLPKSLVNKGKINSFFAISNVCIHIPSADRNEVLETVNRADRLSIQCGKEHLIEIVLNDRSTKKIVDFRPEIPLIMYW
ncbi:VOC family protein [Pleurocapsales cyanobacterium LEGE 10410]|nr:VOC family protein [Pleurocapsales cyanobacterium LEGE 10410]